MTATGGDPAELRALARGGPGQAFLLDHRARVLAAAEHQHRRGNGSSRVSAAPSVGEVQQLAHRAAVLDGWVLHVAALLERADGDPLRHGLLQLGAGHPALVGVAPHATVLPEDVDVTAFSDRDLNVAARWPGTIVAWRDRLHRERARRWLHALPDRLDDVPPHDLHGPGGLFARWFDRVLVDKLSPVVDLHRTAQERRDLHTVRAEWLERLLARSDLTVLSFDPVGPGPAGGPALRVALGDVTEADHLAVVLPGTSVALHAPVAGLTDAMTLHDAAGRATDDSVATVLDLYDAPFDLGRAADPRTGDAAGAATGAWLTDLTGALPLRPRTTLVGHSYGAYTAARSAAAAPDHVDALVLLGAPGVGAVHRDDLGLPASTEVWAARAPSDPVGVVADLDELVGRLPPSLQRRLRPLTHPLAALGPDPVDPEFGARRLPPSPTPGAPGTPITGHVSYLEAGTASVAAVAAVVAGRDPRVRPARPPRRDRRATAAGG